MVAKAMNRKAVPVYEARGFRSGETVNALRASATSAPTVSPLRKPRAS